MVEVVVVVVVGSGVEIGLEGKPWRRRRKKKEEGGEKREVSRGNVNVNGDEDNERVENISVSLPTQSSPLKGLHWNWISSSSSFLFNFDCGRSNLIRVLFWGCFRYYMHMGAVVVLDAIKGLH